MFEGRWPKLKYENNLNAYPGRKGQGPLSYANTNYSI